MCPTVKHIFNVAKFVLHKTFSYVVNATAYHLAQYCCSTLSVFSPAYRPLHFFRDKIFYLCIMQVKVCHSPQEKIRLIVVGLNEANVTARF